jgi:hypothetical protein
MSTLSSVEYLTVVFSFKKEGEYLYLVWVVGWAIGGEARLTMREGEETDRSADNN